MELPKIIINPEDRSRWTGCDYCNRKYCESCRYACYELPKEPCATCILGGSKVRYEPMNYCPICGRPLTEDAWAELERRTGGESNGT